MGGKQLQPDGSALGFEVIRKRHHRILCFKCLLVKKLNQNQPDKLFPGQCLIVLHRVFFAFKLWIWQMIDSIKYILSVCNIQYTLTIPIVPDTL